MKIISHRGLWENEPEKNSRTAFLRSFNKGHGTETDVRAYKGSLVISHDIPTGNEISLVEFMDVLNGLDLTIALNIKSDGLSQKVSEAMLAYPDTDWFVFDMSIPDQRAHIRKGNPVFTRMSEVEQTPAWLDHSQGVWLDSFNETWYSNDIIHEILNLGKRVCIVSPELHGRDHRKLWQKIIEFRRNHSVILCTDLPVLAKEFFKG